MRDPSLWSFKPPQTPAPFDVMTGDGTPEIFTYVEPQANQATANFICLWQDRYTVVRHLLGTGVYGTGPVVHPTRTDLFAKRAVITGIHAEGFDGNWAEYAYAKLNVTFNIEPQGSIGNGGTTSFITVNSEAAGEYMTLPGRALVWDAGAPLDAGKPLSEPQQIFIPIKHHKVTVHQWFSPPFSAMDTASGGVNQSSTSWIGRTIGAERLLFQSYSESVDIPLFGFSTYKVEMSFAEKVRSWNEFPHVGAAVTWQEVSPNPFTPRDFSGIFP